MEGSLVESHCVLAPGTVVTPGRLIPYGQLWAGNPARFVRNLTSDEVSTLTVDSQAHTVCQMVTLMLSKL